MLLKTQRFTFTLLFLVLVTVLSWYSRPAADDYYFNYLTNEYGPIGASLHQYVHFSGRWFCHLFTCTLLEFSSSRFFYPLFFIATFVILYFVVSALFYKIYSRFSIEEDEFNSDFASLLLIAGFFLTSFSIGEIWFWFLSSTTYIWSLIFSLIALNCFLKINDSKLTKPLIAFCSLYIGTASESYAITIILLLLTYIVIKSRTSSWTIFQTDQKNKKIIFSLAIISIAFCSSIFSPGTFARNELLPSISIGDRLVASLKSLVKIYFIYLPARSWIFALLGGPWLVFGYYIQDELNLTSKEIFQKIRWVIGFTFLLICISLIPASFILGEPGPERTLSIVSLIFTLSSATLFTLVGMFFQREKRITFLANAFLFLSIVYISYQCMNQYKLASVYATMYDDRINLINEFKNNHFKGTADLQPLPESGFLYNAELRDDTSYFVNTHWKKGLGLDFNLAVHK